MTDQSLSELYGFWRSSATFRVRVALALKGIATLEKTIDLDAGAQRDPDFLKINPMGAVPALVESGLSPLTQSTAILEYLDETVEEPPLLPGDPRGRARVRSIAAMLAGDTHPLVVPRVKRYLNEEGGFDDTAWRAWQIHWFTSGLRAVEARLATETETSLYCHGDTVTIADICLASVTAVRDVFKIVVAEIPTIDRIVQRCEALPAFAGANPAKQTGAPTRAA
jgi:maleylacetoacetate isomerase